VLAWLEQKNYWDLQELQAYLEDSYKCISLQSYYELFHQGISWKKTQKRNPKDTQLVEKKAGLQQTRSASNLLNQANWWCCL